MNENIRSIFIAFLFSLFIPVVPLCFNILLHITHSSPFSIRNASSNNLPLHILQHLSLSPSSPFLPSFSSTLLIFSSSPHTFLPPTSSFSSSSSSIRKTSSVNFPTNSPPASLPSCRSLYLQSLHTVLSTTCSSPHSFPPLPSVSSPLQLTLTHRRYRHRRRRHQVKNQY